MICLRPDQYSFEDICKEHCEFVYLEVKNRIEFYIGFLSFIREYLDSKEKSERFSVNYECFVSKQVFKKSARISLLKKLLSKSCKFDETDHIFVLANRENYVFQKDEFDSISDLLSDLLSSIKEILYLDFSLEIDKNYSQYDKWKEQFSILNFLLPTIIDYDKWFSKLPTTKNWGPYQLASAIGIKSCPYCNRQYTLSVYEKRGRKFGRPDFDHFISKDKNPLLALSFYNLIPSCKGCNHIKGNKETSYRTHLSPYEINPMHGNMRFNYTPLDYASSIGKGENIKVKVEYSGDPDNSKLKKKVESNIDLFGLKHIYEHHTDVVREIIEKRHSSNDKYMEVLQRTFRNFPLSQEHIYRLAFGNYYNEVDFHKRPLSKLTKDIAIELKVLEKLKKTNSF